MPERTVDPSVSVVIPCYRQAHVLAECVASVQAQTHADWEAIIVNDGSPDDTRAVAQDLVAGDSRLRYVEKTNGGPASARNAGLRETRGRWIQFLDADDLIEPRKFELQIERLSTAAHLAFCYCDYWRGTTDDPRVRLERGILPREFRLRRPVLDMALRWEWDLSIPIHTALFDARLFRDRGVCFNESLRNNEDWDMWMQVLRHVPTILYLRQELAIYRHSLDSVSSNRDLMWQGFSAAVRNQIVAYADDPEVMEGLAFTLRMIADRYHLTWRSRVRRAVGRSGAFRRHCPWPIQKFIARHTGPPDRPATLG
jgi:hypothetical protein